MKVLLLSPQFSEYGGLETYIKTISDGFSNIGLEYSSYYLNTQRSDFEGMGYCDYKQVYEILDDYDIIHFTRLISIRGQNPYLKKLLNDILEKKIVVGTIHQPVEFEYGPDKETLKKFGAVIVMRKYSESGLNFVSFPMPIKLEKCLKDKENVVVSPTRIDEEKFIHLLVKASPMINGKVEMWGAPSTKIKSKSYFEKLKKLPEWNNVEYRGKFGESKECVYEKAKCVVDMSYWKGAGGVQYTLLEAMNYCCVPIFNRRWDIGGENVDILRAYNSRSIANCVNKVFSDDEFRERIVKNNSEFIKKHDHIEVAKGYKKLYEILLGIRRGVLVVK